MVRDFYSTRDCPNTRNTAQQHTLTTHDFGALWRVPLDFQLRFFFDFSINVLYYYCCSFFPSCLFVSFLFFVSRFCSELEVELVFLLDFLGWVSRLEEGSCGAKPSPAQLSEAKHSRQSITNHLIQSRVILVPAFVQYRKRLLRFWRSITNMLAVNYNNLNLEFHLDWIKPVIVCRSLGYLISTVPRR